MAKPARKTPAPRTGAEFKVSGYTPETIFQKIKSEDLFEIMDFDPIHVPWMYVSNVLQRVLARAIGQGPYGPVPIKCNVDGALFVSGVGGAYTRNETKSGNVTDAYLATPVTFSAVMGRVDIFIFDNPVKFKRSRDGVITDDEIELFKDAFYSFDCDTLQINIKNKTAAATARYQFVGWFGQGT